MTFLTSKDDLQAWAAERARRVEAMPEDSAAEIQAKQQAYAALAESSQLAQQRDQADLWTAAFFWPIPAEKSGAAEIVAPSQAQLRRLRESASTQPTDGPGPRAERGVALFPLAARIPPGLY